MFGQMKAQPVTRVAPSCALGEAVNTLIAATDGAQAVRWIEFGAAVLLLVMVPGNAASGAIYVLDRKSGVWLWVDFEDDAYGGYSESDFCRLVHDYDLLSLVERPALLRADSGWILEFGKPAEMAVNA